MGGSVAAIVVSTAVVVASVVVVVAVVAFVVDVVAFVVVVVVSAAVVVVTAVVVVVTVLSFFWLLVVWLPADQENACRDRCGTFAVFRIQFAVQFFKEPVHRNENECGNGKAEKATESVGEDRNHGKYC